MKRAAIGHPKLVDLAHALRARGLPHPSALADGILHGLECLVARHAMAGDVGKFSDARIARACNWEGEDGDWLVATLVEIGWLDRHPEHRLVMHDWWEHCDDAVHRAVARARLWFVCGRAPRFSRLNKEERRAAQEFYLGSEQPELPAEDTESDPRRETCAHRAHVVREPRPVPSSSSRDHSRIVPPLARAGQHVTRRAPSRVGDENDRSFSKGNEGAVVLTHRPVEPSWAPSPDERKPCSAVAAGRDQPRAVVSLVYEMQSRLCDQGDPWNLEVIAAVMPPEEIERGLFAVVGRRKDGLPMVNAAAYFVTTMKNRARELGLRLDFRRPARAAGGGA